MQRIISLETSRNPNTSTEFVSKRFCFSILFSIAFLFLLAGYLLGRYTTDRAILLRQAYMRQRLSLDENNPMDIVLKNMSESIKSIKQATLHHSKHNVSSIYDELLCQKAGELPTLKEFEDNVNIMRNRILSLHLESLSRCFSSVDNLLQKVSPNDSI